MAIGEIEVIEAGTPFQSRRALHDARIHSPLQAGIAGGASVGAESIVLSGGYIDDEDYGDELIYTGHGGRDPTSGRQVADQEFACLLADEVRQIVDEMLIVVGTEAGFQQ